MEKLRLFVVGEYSGDPKEWLGNPSLRILILAESPDQVMELLGDDYEDNIIEVTCDSPVIVSQQRGV